MTSLEMICFESRSSKEMGIRLTERWSGSGGWVESVEAAGSVSLKLQGPPRETR